MQQWGFCLLGGVLGEKYTSILLVYMVYREDDVFFFQVGGWEFSSKKPLIMGSIENDWERP